MLIDKIDEALTILDAALILAEDYKVAGIIGLFSGGNDSTVLAHLFRNSVTHYAHANTSFGIEKTREFVRRTCRSWDVPLIEKFPKEGETYRDLVLGNVKTSTGRQVWPGGFPGPAMHYLFFQRMKERGLEQVRNEIITNPYKERVIFIAGRRAEESSRRSSRTAVGSLSELDKKGSIIWASPFINWNKHDLNEYRKMMGDVPENEVAACLHMSGECLCGCFAHPLELDEISFWYPSMGDEIRSLEKEVQDKWKSGNLPGVKWEHCFWGWSGIGACASGLCNN